MPPGSGLHTRPVRPDDEPARLFAYGTLQPGRLRWPFLAPYALGHRPAAVPGRIYDSGYGWPLASFATAAQAVSPGTIPGTLIDLDPVRLAEALALLDEVENTATDLVVRIRVTATDGTAAWAYHAPVIPPEARPITVWDAVDER